MLLCCCIFEFTLLLNIKIIYHCRCLHIKNWIVEKSWIKTSITWGKRTECVTQTACGRLQPVLKNYNYYAKCNRSYMAGLIKSCFVASISLITYKKKHWSKNSHLIALANLIREKSHIKRYRSLTLVLRRQRSLWSLCIYNRLYMYINKCWTRFITIRDAP